GFGGFLRLPDADGAVDVLSFIQEKGDYLVAGELLDARDPLVRDPFGQRALTGSKLQQAHRHIAWHCDIPFRWYLPGRKHSPDRTVFVAHAALDHRRGVNGATRIASVPSPSAGPWGRCR